MFAYCGNNPVNYRDNDGHSPTAILVDGVIAGIVSLINAAVFGATRSEMIKAFLSGFLQGAVCSATSGFAFGNAIKYAIILYDVGSAVYECWESGASIEECALVALVQLWAAFSFDDLETDQLFDLVFGLGATLCATGISKGIQRQNSLKEDRSTSHSQRSKAQKSYRSSKLTGQSGYALPVVYCKAE